MESVMALFPQLSHNYMSYDLAKSSQTPFKKGNCERTIAVLSWKRTCAKHASVFENRRCLVCFGLYVLQRVSDAYAMRPSKKSSDIFRCADARCTKCVCNIFVPRRTCIKKQCSSVWQNRRYRWWYSLNRKIWVIYKHMYVYIYIEIQTNILHIYIYIIYILHPYSRIYASSIYCKQICTYTTNNSLAMMFG